MLKLDEIAAFVAVAEAGSISEAARRMRLSKSVVSERLAEIERSLGTPLLHRIDVGLQSEEEHVVVAHAEGRRSSAKLRALADWLRTAFGNPPYWDR